MKKSALWIQAVILLAFLAAFFLLNLVLPDRDFSEQENRYLQAAPHFSFSELFSGKFTSKFETYVTDQFAFRDTWTSLKARVERLTGKDSNNDVFLCSGDTLIEPFAAPSADELRFRLDAINTLTDTAGIPVYFALIPSASEIWSDLLPVGAPNDSQADVIDFAYDYSNAFTADVLSALRTHVEEPLFYRTDHHWTTLGAYYGYTAIAEAMGFAPLPLEEYTETKVTDAFYGTAYSSSGYAWVEADSISAYVEQGSAEITNYPNGDPVESALYDETALNGKDKYKYFYGGNTPLITVKTGNEDAPSLLILRDSYMDSLSPYLFAHFSEIHILDLRYYRASLKAYLAEHEIDNILVCYSVKNFSEDGNIFLAAY